CAMRNYDVGYFDVW
nr:immunoglobulin heavy chain junction region [Mus musculus]NSM04800.1 immunoglobulin heavy chain junction region [Mus musculus]NSM05108.1 immunoglobulin heavy chain junction region [Mus musculus]NSM09753.1 immunoglobulin heavy chain junction region [Mus musculus]